MHLLAHALAKHAFFAKMDKYWVSIQRSELQKYKKKLEISKRLRFQREGEKKTKVGRYKILKLLKINREGLSS